MGIVAELVEKLRGGEIKAKELIEIYLERIKILNPKINAFLTLNHRVMEDVKEASKKPLAGLPIAVKDNTCTKGLRTTYGSKIFENFVPNEDAVIVERLKKAGAVVIGKTNLPEFGLLAHTDNLISGVTRNPWNLNKTVGGSSGGSAAAVAAEMVPAATGNDGGGSIRIPASFCSLYGLKPTFGRIPVYPKIPVFIGLTCEGFLTKYVEDTAFLLDFVKGWDDRDLYSLPDDGKSYFKEIDEPIDNVKIAFSSNLGYAKVDPEVEEIVRRAAFKLEKVGEVEEIKINIPCMEKELIVKIQMEFKCFISDKMEKWKKLAYPTYIQFINMDFTFMDYFIVERKKLELWKNLRKIFKYYDFLTTPTTAVKPFDVERVKNSFAPVEWFPFTYPFNFTGQPAASIPAGFTEDGLPVGMQIVGRKFDDLGVLKISKVFQDINKEVVERRPRILENL